MNYLVKRDAILLHSDTIPSSYPHGTAYVLCTDVAHEGDHRCVLYTIFSTYDGIRFKLQDAELKNWAVEIPDSVVKKLRALEGGITQW